MSFFSSVLDFLFPPKCMFCRRVLKNNEQGCCQKCAESLAIDLPERTGSSFERCCAPLVYKDSVRGALIRFKFQDRPGYATGLGRIMAQCIQKHYAGAYDLITWVPVSAQRLRQRGYDQAMLLAMAAALELGDVAVETLKKCKDTPAQSSLDGAEQRRDNVVDAYAPVDPELVRGKRVLLVDDIVTTGATLEEASRTLKGAGAAAVLAVAVAQTEHSEVRS